jgi:hypothetical protein
MGNCISPQDLPRTVQCPATVPPTFRLCVRISPSLAFDTLYLLGNNFFAAETFGSSTAKRIHANYGTQYSWYLRHMNIDCTRHCDEIVNLFSNFPLCHVESRNFLCGLNHNKGTCGAFSLSDYCHLAGFHFICALERRHLSASFITEFLLTPRSGSCSTHSAAENFSFNSVPFDRRDKDLVLASGKVFLVSNPRLIGESG